MDGPRSKVELFAAVRRDSRTEKLSIHELSRRYGVHRRLIREALTSPWPTPRKPLPPRPSVIDPYKHLIDAILRADWGPAFSRRPRQAASLAENSPGNSRAVIL